MDIDYLEQAIGAMLMAKVITFEANSWAFGFVDMVVKSTVFVEPESIISVVEDDWNDGHFCTSHLHIETGKNVLGPCRQRCKTAGRACERRGTSLYPC